MDITRWSTLKSVRLYYLSRKWKSSIQSEKTRLGAECGSNHELLIVKFRFKLKKLRKTIRTFRYDLNQIPYNHTVEVKNRFKEKDLIEYLKNIVQEAVIKTIPKKKKCKKTKWLSEEALQIPVNRREVKGKGEKEG